MALSPVARENFILDCMAHMGGGTLANQQANDNLSRLFGSDAAFETGKIIYNLAVILADRYDIENP